MIDWFSLELMGRIDDYQLEKVRIHDLIDFGRMSVCRALFSLEVSRTSGIDGFDELLDVLRTLNED
jgi:hypothetical protein